MSLSEEARGQVHDAALNELRGANMEEMTERKLRTALEKQLGMELGGSEERKFLRGIIGEFLDQEEVGALWRNQGSFKWVFETTLFI